MPRRVAINMMGKRIGALVVTEQIRPRAGKSRWICRCDCGSSAVVSGGHLRDGSTFSCGCIREKTAPVQATTHGMSYSREYRIWIGIVSRCRNTKDSNYRKYGARGIQVCDRWADSFDAFYADVGPRPSPKHSVDRRENDGHYEPSNCRWATHAEQARNKRGSPKLYPGDFSGILSFGA